MSAADWLLDVGLVVTPRTDDALVVDVLGIAASPIEAVFGVCIGFGSHFDGQVRLMVTFVSLVFAFVCLILCRCLFGSVGYCLHVFVNVAMVVFVSILSIGVLTSLQHCPLTFLILKLSCLCQWGIVLQGGVMLCVASAWPSRYSMSLPCPVVWV